MPVNILLHMLRIFNDLKPFFENNYRRINVREYARIRGISPPSSSKLLGKLENEGLLLKEEEKNYIYYTANREDGLFIALSRAYWLFELRSMGLIGYLERELASPLIILFGSFAKAEIIENSDIDIAIFTPSKKSLKLDMFEKRIKRKIQLFTFANKGEIKNENLFNSINNGFILSGSW